MLDTMHYVLGAFSGGLVGFTLGLVGGGGSILAVPLLVYLVGVKSPHIAIGTSALAVAANAAIGLANHFRAGNVKWRCGLMYAGAGIIGAFGGSTLGKQFDGQKLLFLFALLMIAVAVLMLRRRKGGDGDFDECRREYAPKVAGYGFGTGLFSGFFGIGGGFLIVPGLMAATGMPMINAVGTSLIAVTAFGLTTALNYAASGMVDWLLAGIFILGGVVGSFIGTRAAGKLAGKGQLTTIFAGLVLVVAFYMLWKSFGAMV